MTTCRLRTVLTFCLAICLAIFLPLAGFDTPQGQFTARDPGVRAGAVDAGKPLASLDANQQAYFAEARNVFAEVTSVKGTAPGAEGKGLGPRFNADSCAACHAQPAIGGSSPSAKHFPHIGPNPQTLVARKEGATNTVPSFIHADGPVREARFKFALDERGQPDSRMPDGGVHAIFTISGRSDATQTVGASGRAQTCRLAQPDFERARRQDNLAFRIPTPLFGGGLIEAIADETILSNFAADAREKRALGINGRPNRSANDGTITRFGWKAQNKSLQLFAGEAYNVEQGVANELFPNERANPGETLPSDCFFNALPEDRTKFENPKDPTVSDLEAFAIFMRFLDAPVPSSTQPGGQASIANGRRVFVESAKCTLCHTPALATQRSSITQGLGPRMAALYSDLLLHNMGRALADGVSQGVAGPDEFRTAPLWGHGQRVFFLHDGRTSDLVEAIRAHASPGSEANSSVELFNRLAERDRQDLLNFLRSL